MALSLFPSPPVFSASLLWCLRSYSSVPLGSFGSGTHTFIFSLFGTAGTSSVYLISRVQCLYNVLLPDPPPPFPPRFTLFLRSTCLGHHILAPPDYSYPWHIDIHLTPRHSLFSSLSVYQQVVHGFCPLCYSMAGLFSSG